MSNLGVMIGKAQRKLAGIDRAQLADYPLADFIADALQRVDKVAPDYYEHTLTGDGSNEYNLDAATGWEDEFSHLDPVRGIRDVPGADYDDDPRFVDVQTAAISRADDGTPRIWLPWSPGASDEVVLRFTKRHVLDNTSSTVRTQDEDALAALSAAKVLEALELKANSLGVAGLELDAAIAGVPSRGDAFARRARSLTEEFEVHFGIRSPPGASPDTEGQVGAVFAKPERVRPRRAAIHRRHTH